MKTVWQGTDSLLLVKFPKELTWKDYIYAIKLRIFARFCDKFAVMHYCCGKLPMSNLRKFGMKKPLVDFKTPLDQSLKVDKIPHTAFNILYYFPERTKLREWIYGWNIFEEVRYYFEDDDRIQFIIVDGSDDMKEIYPYIDLMIRPNRHDGYPRMVAECEMNDIPYYWSNENPKLLDIIDKINGTKE